MTALKTKLMCHLVAGYPSWELSLQAAEAMVEGGAKYLEVQFPFSDPTADGPKIQAACHRSLEVGFTVEKGFELVSALHRRFPQLPICLMSYASLLYRRGMLRFLTEAKKAGVFGLIVPDLPYDQDEGLFRGCWDKGLHPIAVVLPAIKESRLKNLLVLLKGAGETYLYVALRTGITGQETKLADRNINFLEKLKEKEFRAFAGFGISTSKQVSVLQPYVEAVVVGSFLVEVIEKSYLLGAEGLRHSVLDAVKSLLP